MKIFQGGLTNHKEEPMAANAMFLGWNRSISGREQQAMQLFQKTMEYYGQLQADGRIESFEPVVLGNHGGDLNGFVLLKGDPEKLDEIRREDTFQEFSIEANYCLENFGVVPGYVGDGIVDVFSRWSKLFSD
jgi:hypothetical protein